MGLDGTLSFLSRVDRRKSAYRARSRCWLWSRRGRSIPIYEKGWKVTAFDVSESAVEWASQLHKGKEIDWLVGDLVQPEERWKEAFDLVLEVHILQAIPEEIRNSAYRNLSPLLDRHGLLMCIGRLANGLEEENDAPPWPLSRDFIHQIGEGLSVVEFHTAVVPDKEEIRYRAVWKRE